MAFIILVFYLSLILVHGSTYNDSFNNCTHMSQRIEQMLETIGIDTKIMHGDNNNGEYKHLWIKIGGVSFDSITLLPFYNDFKYNEITEYNSYEDAEPFFVK